VMILICEVFGFPHNFVSGLQSNKLRETAIGHVLEHIHRNGKKKNVSNTLFWTLSLLLDQIQVGVVTLSGTHS